MARTGRGAHRAQNGLGWRSVYDLAISRQPNSRDRRLSVLIDLPTLPRSNKLDHVSNLVFRKRLCETRHGRAWQALFDQTGKSDITNLANGTFQWPVGERATNSPGTVARQ